METASVIFPFRVQAALYALRAGNFGGSLSSRHRREDQAGHSDASEITAIYLERDPTVTSVSWSKRSRKARIFVKIKGMMRDFSLKIVYGRIGCGWVKRPKRETVMLRKM